MSGEMLAGPLLDILAFGGQNNSPSGDIAVAGSDNTTAVWSNSFPLRRGVTYSFSVKFTSSGGVAVKIELEQSNVRPVTEGATDSNWCVPDNKTTAMFTSVNDTNMHNAPYAPNATGFGRLKITGLTGNDASTKLHVAQAYGIKSV